MKLRNFLYCLTILTLLASVSCAQKPPAQTSNPGRGKDQPASGAGSAVITFAVYDYQRPIFKDLAEEFTQENPEIKVQLVDIPNTFPTTETGEPVNWLKTMASLADTVILWGPALVEPNADSYLMDLDPLIAGDALFQPDDFWPGMLQSCQNTNSRTLGIPLTASLRGIFFHPQAFEAAGIALPKPGWTWEDFQKAVQALGDPGSDPPRYAYADQDRIENSVLAPLVDQVLARQQGLTDAAILQGQLQWYIDAASQGKLRSVRSSLNTTDQSWQANWNEWQKLFSDESTHPAMWAGSLSDMPPDAAGFPGDDPYQGSWIATEGFAPFPVSPETANDHTTPVFTECLVLSAGTQHPREAWAWAHFLTRHWIIQSHTQIWEVGRIPARRSVADAEGFWTLLPDQAEEAVRFGLEHGWSGTLYPQELDAVNEALAQSTANGADFTSSLAQSLARIQGVPTPTPETAAVIVATPRPTPALGASDVRFYMGGYDPREYEAYKTIADQFMREYPHISVTVEDQFFTGDYQNWLRSLSQDFDCVYTHLPYLDGQTTDLFLDLTSYYETEGSAFSQDFNPDLLSLYRYEGRLIGVPGKSRPQTISYNADLLAKLGLPEPRQDWTIQEFLDLATQVGRNTSGDYYGFMTYPSEEMLWAGLNVRWGLPDEEPPQAFFNSGAVEQHVQWMISMQQEGVFFFLTSDNWDRGSEIMRGGRAAFWGSLAGNPLGDYFSPDETVDFHVRVLPLPAIDSPNELAMGSDELGYFIFKNSKYPQACWEWIHYVSAQPGAFMGVPARKSVQQDPAWVRQVGPENAPVYLESISRIRRGVSAGSGSWGWPLYNFRYEAIEAALGGASPRESLNEAQNKADAFLQCAQKAGAGLLEGAALDEQVTACAKQADPGGPWQ